MNKKLIYASLTIILLLMQQTIKAQVTIGSHNAPSKAALLDLKEQDNPSGGANSSLGLILPRVSLQDVKNLYPMYTGNENDYTTLKATNKGLIVYNVTVDPGKSLQEGLYGWNGTEWVLISAGNSWNKIGSTTSSTANIDDSYLNAKAVVGGNAPASINGGTNNAQFTVMNNDASINGLTIGKGRGQISSNTVVGSSALSANTTGVNNTAIGSSALNKNTTGGNNTMLGYNAGTNNTTGSNNIVVGSNINIPDGTLSNQINIGNALYGTASSTAAGGQISIGKTKPDAAVALDVQGTTQVNGSFIMKTASSIDNSSTPLVRDNTTGQVGLAPQRILSVTVASGATETVDVSTIFSPGPAFMTISSGNICGRSMNTIFSIIVDKDFSMPISYINGMGRNIVGIPTKDSDFSYTMVFPKVNSCADTGDDTQFDYAIDTTTPGVIKVTNNGNITRIYTIKISKI